MIESVSCDELYEKFHAFYIAVIRLIICNTTLTRKDGTTIDAEMLHRAQEHCIAVYEELHAVRYQHVLNKVPGAQLRTRPLSVLTLTVSSVDDGELLPAIEEKYAAILSKEEFDLLGELFDAVADQIELALGLSFEMLKQTNDIS